MELWHVVIDEALARTSNIFSISMQILCPLPTKQSMRPTKASIKSSDKPITRRTHYNSISRHFQRRNSMKPPEAKTCANCRSSSRTKQPTFRTLTLRFGCSTFARYPSSSPEQGVQGLNVRLYRISTETTYCVVAVSHCTIAQEVILDTPHEEGQGAGRVAIEQDITDLSDRNTTFWENKLPRHSFIRRRLER